MDIERALETQRQRLLRIIATLVGVVGVLTLGPVSCRFSDWTLSFVHSILRRAEAATKNLVITQAYLIGGRSGLRMDARQIAGCLAPILPTSETEISLPDCQKRLKALRLILSDLPRHAARLVRRIDKEARRAVRTIRVPHHGEGSSFALLSESQLITNRIERPPDKIRALHRSFYLFLPPPENRAGGVGS